MGHSGIVLTLELALAATFQRQCMILRRRWHELLRPAPVYDLTLALALAAGAERYDLTMALALAAGSGRRGMILPWRWNWLLPRDAVRRQAAILPQHWLLTQCAKVRSYVGASQYAAQTLRICCSTMQIPCARPAHILHRPCEYSAHNRPYEYAGTLSYDLPHHYNHLN